MVVGFKKVKAVSNELSALSDLGDLNLMNDDSLNSCPSWLEVEI